MDLSPGPLVLITAPLLSLSPVCDWLSLSEQGSTLGAVCVCIYIALMGLFLLERIEMQRLTILTTPLGYTDTQFSEMDKIEFKDSLSGYVERRKEGVEGEVEADGGERGRRGG